MSASPHAAADAAPEPTAVCRPVSKSAAAAAARCAAAAAALAVLLATGSCRDRGPTGPAETVDRTLTVVVSGQGAGTITSQPTGIDCSAAGGTCSLTVPNGTQVTLTANAADRSNFGGWTDGCAGNGACMIMLNADRTVGAAFDNAHLATAEIGPAGGTLTSSDGKVVLTVPAGALGGTVPITIESIEIGEAGPEFDGLVDNPDLDVAAYRMGPAGQSFASPVQISVRSDQVPQLAENSIAMRFEVLLTSHNDAVVPLDSLVMEVTADQITVHGAVTHFSPLILAGWLEDDERTFSGRFTFRATGVPDAVFWTEPFPVTMNLLVEHFREGSVIDAFVRDASIAPVVAPTDFARLERVGQTPSAESPFSWTTEFSERFDYRCSMTGSGTFKTSFEIDVKDTFVVLPGLPPVPIRTRISAFRGLTFGVSKPVTCTLNPPMPSGLQLIPGGATEIGGLAHALSLPRSTQQGATTEAISVGEDGTRTDIRIVQPGTGSQSHAGFPVTAMSGTSGPQLEVVRTIEDYCRYATEVFFHRHPTSAVAAQFVALQPDTVRGCRGVLGTTQKSTVGFASYVPNGVQVGTSHIVYSDFGRGMAHVRHIFEDPSGRHDVVLAPGKRSCPWGSDSHASVALIVAREGAVGTSNEECNETRGLYKLEVQGFASTALTGSLLIGTMPREVVISTDGGTAYLADYAEKRIHVIDVASMTATGTIPAPGGPTSLALTSDGALLLAAYWDTNEVAAIDLASGAELAREASGGEQPVKVRLSSDEQIVWVLNYGKEGVANAVVRVFRLVRP